MNSYRKWVALFLGVFIVAFMVALPLFSGNGWGWMPMREACENWTGVAGGFRGSHMFGGFGFFGGWLMMLGMLIVPLLLLGIVGLGFVALAKLVIKPQSSVVAKRSCANCGKDVHADWVNCPYCGKQL